jgi:hypothetical protein
VAQLALEQDQQKKGTLTITARTSTAQTPHNLLAECSFGNFPAAIAQLTRVTKSA